jgi:hypothetical protein
MRVDLYGATGRMVWKARGDERIKGFDAAIQDAGEGSDPHPGVGERLGVG